MLVACSYVNCGDRRIHWEKPDVPRGPQHFEIPDDYVGPAYCSIECAYYDEGIKNATVAKR